MICSSGIVYDVPAMSLLVFDAENGREWTEIFGARYGESRERWVIRSTFFLHCTLV